MKKKMKKKKFLSFVMVLAMAFSLVQILPLGSSASSSYSNESVEASWEKYLKESLPTDKSLRTYGEHTKILSEGGHYLPVEDQFYVYKIHTSLSNSTSFVKESLEKLIKTSYESVMNEEIYVTILSGYEEAYEKYSREGDGGSTTDKYRR